jgi:uncharacterized membrane protein YdjX (TVP38/TMEM64 family)
MRLLFIPLVFLCIGAIGAVVFDSFFEVPASFDEAIAWLRSYERWAWAIAMAVIIGDVLLPLPSLPALIALGIIYGPFFGGVLGGIAMTLGGVCGFVIARTVGRRAALYLIGEHDVTRAQRFFDRWGIHAVTLGRAIGGPAECAVVFAGIAGMAFPRVLAALMMGGFSASFVNAWLGSLAVERPVLAVILVVSVLGALAYLARRVLWAPPSVN